MTPERAARLVATWVRLYTFELPRPIGERRRTEIAADAYDHIAYEREAGTPERHISISIISRMARGIADDISWRRRAQPATGGSMKPFIAVIVVALGIAFAALTLDSPLLVLLSVAILAGDIIAMFVFGLKRAQRGNFVLPFVAILVAALGLAALACAAIVIGERGDAPGLVLLGIMFIVSVIVGVFALGIRTGQARDVDRQPPGPDETVAPG